MRFHTRKIGPKIVKFAPKIHFVQRDSLFVEMMRKRSNLKFPKEKQTLKNAP